VTPFDRPAFALPPVADRVGPFPHGEFLSTVWNHTADPADELMIAHDTSGLVGMACVGGSWMLAGSGDLVDYRSPLGTGIPELVAGAVRSLGAGASFSFDSLPAEAAETIAAGLDLAGVKAEVAQHAVAAVLHLPDTFDDYLALIGKKERHELRRKRRRYEAALGEARFVHHVGTGPVFDDFVRLHRLAHGDKGGFMTEEMESMFADLACLPGWGIDALVADDGHVTAAGFGYMDDDGYYLYNSAYNPELSDASPGVVLLGRLIELSIERGKRVFDFLKGDEHYKYRLGAVARPLFEIEGRT